MEWVKLAGTFQIRLPAREDATFSLACVIFRPNRHQPLGRKRDCTQARVEYAGYTLSLNINYRMSVSAAIGEAVTSPGLL